MACSCLLNQGFPPSSHLNFSGPGEPVSIGLGASSSQVQSSSKSSSEFGFSNLLRFLETLYIDPKAVNPGVAATTVDCCTVAVTVAVEIAVDNSVVVAVSVSVLTAVLVKVSVEINWVKVMDEKT